MKRIVIVYSVAVFRNFFSLIAKNTETNSYCYIEVSNRKNNLDLLYTLFSNKNYIFASYNGIHYHNAIVNYILSMGIKFPRESESSILSLIHNITKTILTGELDDWKEYKYGKNFAFIDLMSMLLKEQKRISFNEMKILIDFPVIRTYNHTIGDVINDYDYVVETNKLNVDATELLTNKCIKDIEFRIDTCNTFSVDVLNKSDISLGVELLKISYLRKTKQKFADIKELKTFNEFINFKDIILPFIEYDSTELKELLDEFKNKIININDKKPYNKKFLYANTRISAGIGGVHTINKPKIIECNQNESIIEVDVNSYFPSIISRYNFKPSHLKDEFMQQYNIMLEKRLKLKNTDNSFECNVLKKALAGAIGNFDNETSWMCDNKIAFAVRINGQLLILKLVEMLFNAGIDIKFINTDGVIFVINNNIDYNSIIGKWCEWSKLTVSTCKYEKIYLLDVNDYIKVYEGYSNTKDKSLIKCGGVFNSEQKFDNKIQCRIVPKAIVEYFINKTPIEEYVRNCKNITDFMMYFNIGKEFDVIFIDEVIPNISRYYVSNNPKAGLLMKQSMDFRKGVITEYVKQINKPIQIINNLENFKFPSDIDYNYYIGKIKEITSKFDNRQLSLFDDFF